MGSETPDTLKLPIINFSSLKPETPEWESVRTQVRKALEEFGCFEAVFDKIPVDLRKAIYERLKELFDLPLETKQRYVSKKPFNSYIGQKPAVPLFEGMGIEDSDDLQKVEALASVFWPNGNPSFCNTIQSFSEQLSELDQQVRRMILESLGVEKYIEEHMGSTNYMLRVMKYKEPQTTDKELGLSSHTDKNMLTILHQNQVDGLEIETKDGQWFSVKPSSDSFIVMIADSFHAWTNGRVHSPMHRVTMRGSEERYSVGLFCSFKGGFTVKAPEELIDEQHPLLYKPFDYIEFLEFLYANAGQRSKSALQSYCNV